MIVHCEVDEHVGYEPHNGVYSRIAGSGLAECGTKCSSYHAKSMDCSWLTQPCEEAAHNYFTGAVGAGEGAFFSASATRFSRSARSR